MEVEEKQRLIWLSGEAGLGVEREEENRALVVRSDLKCWILHDMQRYREQKPVGVEGRGWWEIWN